jgi:ribosomal protein S18 acetylase RimI-like enzyme
VAPSPCTVNLPELRRVADSLRRAAAATRDTVVVDGFALYLSADSAHPFMSLAVPEDPEREDWGTALAALPAVFAAHGRRPRIEAFAELHPALLRAADAAGWRRAMTAPVLKLSPAALAASPAVVGAFGWLAPDDGGRLEAALRGSHLAYGGTEGDPAALDWAPQLVRGLRQGALIAGTVEVDGAPRAGAVVQLGGDAGELAGVWTHPDFRRRGLARQACHALLAGAFARGVPSAWLSAAEGALGLYEGLGFVNVGTQVNLEPPAQA